MLFDPRSSAEYSDELATPPVYEVFAIRYARRDARRAEHFAGGDAHDGPMPMDYFVWLIRAPDGEGIVVDVGFTHEVAVKRKRTMLRSPAQGLKLLGVEAGAVRDVVITHLHYDHVGCFADFPSAQFHIQEPELHFAVGRQMRHGHLRHTYEVEDIVGIVRLNFQERVRLYNGAVRLRPGLTLHPAPGHTPGLQFVRVNTRRGPVILASDVTHYYENIESNRPFPVAVNFADLLDSFERVRAAAASPDHIIPGHDPQVMQRYPAPDPSLEGIAVRLDVAPHVPIHRKVN